MTSGVAAGVIALLLSGRAHGTAPAHWHDDERPSRNAVASECYLSPHDVALIERYYRERTRPAPAGLSRQLQRTAHLSPGWEQRLEPLPVTVDRELAVLPHGLRRGLLDGYAVIYDLKTETIVDAVALFHLH